MSKVGKSITVDNAERRPGDPLVDAKAALKILNWQSEYSSLEVVVEHAWA